jgi:ATP-binding cassette subfamily C protein
VSSEPAPELSLALAQLAASDAASSADVDSLASARLLDDPESVWLVEQGRLDLFAVELHEGRAAGARRFLWSAEAPSVVFGLPVASVQGPETEDRRPKTEDRRQFGLLAAGATGVRVRRVPLDAVRALAARPDTARTASALVDTFIARTSALIGRAVESPLVSPPDIAADADVSAGAGGSAGGAFSDGVAWGALARCSTGLTDWIGSQAIALEARERGRLTRKAGAERQMVASGVASLAATLASGEGVPVAEADGDALLAACRAVGTRARIEFQQPPAWETERRVHDPLAAICRASRVRHRRVALRGDWWRSNNGPLLGYIAEGERPVALLPSGHHSYDLFDPALGERTPVDRAASDTLDPFAVEFYRPSPDRPIGLVDLGRMALAEARGDIARLLLAALAGSLLGLVLPIATGQVFSEIIPMAVPANIVPLLATLVAFTLASTFFDLTHAMALIRIEGRTNTALQSMIVDRLLALPVPFFRAYSVGDLAMRAGAVNAARSLLSGAVLSTLLEGAFSIVSVGLLFYYSPTLAFVALGVLAVSIAFTTVFAVLTIRVERRRQAVEGTVAGLVFEMIGGLAKLRVAGAERRAFAVWARLFREQSQLAFRVGMYGNQVAVFNDILPVVARLALLGTAGSLLASGTSLDTGSFVAFNAAFGSFIASGVQLSGTLINSLNIIPIMERAQPILGATLETTGARPDPGELTGRIEVSHVSFRYKADGAAILRDVSVRAAAGEFIALVGPSGSGKSTLLRLLLGFEAPESGGIYFDEQDLGLLDLSAVRSQMGVVMQTSRLLAGDLFRNIVGSAPLTVNDAWEAAAMSGLADDIRAMPMGMNTMVSEGGSTLSGGQRQRLLIARALVRRPRIVLFDEATSALDNQTQQIVSHSLEHMKATRIVIAHRLSTVRNADRIFVMEAGTIVQQGSYDELAAAPGVFARMIARQLI